MDSCVNGNPPVVTVLLDEVFEELEVAFKLPRLVLALFLCDVGQGHNMSTAQLH